MTSQESKCLIVCCIWPELEESTGAIKVEDIQSPWALGYKESWKVVTPGFRASLIYSQCVLGSWIALRSDRKFSRGLMSRVNPSAQVGFVLIWPQTGWKEKWRRTKAWSEFADVKRHDRQFSLDPRQRWPRAADQTKSNPVRQKLSNQ